MQPESPIRTLTREQVRELDRAAIEDYGMPGLILMENAGRAAADEAVEMLGGAIAGERVCVFAGKGNNGGDGFVIARHLHNRGAQVSVKFLGDVGAALQGDSDAAVNLRIIKRMGLPIEELASDESLRQSLEDARRGGLIIDAVFGTGLNGPLRGQALALIQGLNTLGVPILAVDIPSGLDANTGKVLGAAIRAQKTVTFVAAKRGFFTGQGPQCTGKVVVAEISIPRELVEKALGEI